MTIHSLAGDPVAEFDNRVRELMTRGLSRADAVIRVAARDQKLHQAYLLATNHGARTQRLIREKFDSTDED